MRYSNDILPAIYNAAFPTKPSFNAYFRGQLQERWSFKNTTEKWEKRLKFWQSSNPAAYGRLINSDPVFARKDDRFITTGIKKTNDLLHEIDQKHQGFREEMETLYKDGKIRSWASEHQKYVDSSITLLMKFRESVMEFKDKLDAAMDMHLKIFKIKSKQSNKGKDKLVRKYKKRNVKRLTKRQEKAALHVLKVLGQDVLTLNECDMITDVDCEKHLSDLKKQKPRRLTRGLDALLQESKLSYGAASAIQTSIEDYVDWKFTAE